MRRESEEITEPDGQTAVAKEPELEDLIGEKEETAIDEDDPKVHDNMEGDDSHQDLEKAEDDIETNYRNPLENKEGGILDLKDKDKPKAGNDLGSESEEEGGEYRL